MSRVVLPEQAKNRMDECAAAAVAEGVAIAVDAEPGAYKGKPPGVKGAKPKQPPADQALKDQASKAKYAAKVAAAKAGLNDEQRIADIDAVLAADRDRLARAEVELLWPARSTVVREVPPSRADKLGQLRKAAARAEEELRMADCHRVAAKRELARARETHTKVCEEMSAASRAQVWAPLETPQSELDAEWEEWVAMQEAAAANIKGMHESFEEADEAWCEAEEAAVAARRAVEAEEDERTAERRAPERAAERAAEREEQQAAMAALKAERAAAVEEMAAAEERAAALTARLKLYPPSHGLAHIFCPSVSPAETRARLECDSAAAWPAGERPATKVFSLVGMSAGNVRAIAGEVCQEVTNCIGRPPPSSPPPPSLPPSPPVRCLRLMGQSLHSLSILLAPLGTLP